MISKSSKSSKFPKNFIRKAKRSTVTIKVIDENHTVGFAAPMNDQITLELICQRQQAVYMKKKEHYLFCRSKLFCVICVELEDFFGKRSLDDAMYLLITKTIRHWESGAAMNDLNHKQ